MSRPFSLIQGSGQTPIGKRLLEAFADKGITNKKAIGEALGFKSDKAIYKVINGEQELSFDALLRFRETTGRSIDWLLADVKPQTLADGEFAMYLGDEEHRIIQKLAGKSKRAFEDEVREQLIEHLEEKNLLTTKTGESNVVFFGDNVPNMVSLPFFGEIAAGEPIMIFEHVDTVDVPDFRRERGKQYIVLRARGDSMIEERIYDGSLIMCEVRNTATKGDTIVAMIDGEKATVKRYYPERGRIRLQPANPTHLPQFVTDDRLQIQGIVVGIFHKPS